MNFRQFRALHDYEEQTDPRTGKTKKVLVYTGDYYTLNLAPAERKSYLRRLWLLWALAAACYLGATFTNALSSHLFYVGGFYLIALFPLGVWGWAIFRLTRQQEPFTQMAKEETVDRLGRYSILTTVLGVCALVGDLYFALRGGWQFQPGVEILFASLLAALTVCSWAAYMEVRRHPVQKSR